MSDIVAEVRGSGGFITLNRPQALNALSLEMIRAHTAALLRQRSPLMPGVTLEHLRRART
jgi:enoyl-CoA hydratase/carnithine racemase